MCSCSNLPGVGLNERIWPGDNGGFAPAFPMTATARPGDVELVKDTGML